MLRANIFFASFLLLTLGVGCTAPSWPKSSTPEERAINAEALRLTSGSKLIVRGTVLGLGGSVAEDLGSDVGRRTVTIDAYRPSQSVDLSWTLHLRRETEASRSAREIYDAEVKGISDNPPPAPKRAFEEVDLSGAMASTSLQDATTIALPAYWVEGDAGIVEDSSLLWLSLKQYDELIDARTSTLSIGLFDDVTHSLELADDVTNALSRLRGQAEEASRYKDIYKLEAMPEFGSTRLVVNGEKKEVRTIQASNWFGTYTILANRDNPLIVKVTLNPLSFGALSLLSPTKILDAFLGYEIVEVTL